MTDSFSLQEVTKSKTVDNRLPSETFPEEKFTYLNIVTDYTSRLLQNEYKQELKELINDHNNITESEFSVLLIGDDVWGKGIYYDSKEKDIVDEYKKLHPITCGCVIFRSSEPVDKSEWFQLANIFVNKVKYCNNCGLNDVKFDKDVLTLDYDCESG
jgi:hypothetical protein